MTSSSGPEAPRMDDIERLPALNDHTIPSFRFAPTPSSKPRYARRDGAPEIEHLWEVFTPSRPQTADQLFVGRRTTIERIIRAIEEEHAHVVVYGGRGIGKTSVGNIITESARRAGYHVARYACDSETNFEQLFRDFLRRLPVDLMDRSAQRGGVPVRSFDQLVHSERLGPTDLSNAFGNLIEHIILIIDEFDRVRDKSFNRKMSEAIKVISDSTDLLTVIIMGIGQTVHELLGQHLSIQRHIRAIRLPLMEEAELQALLRRGERRAGINFENAVRDSIVTLSKGTPYYVHLLALLAGRHALGRNSTTVGFDDLRAAISDLLSEIDPNLVTAYEGATRSEWNLFMTDIVFAAAAAPFDAYGRFRADGVLKVLESHTGKSHRIVNIHGGLARLSKNERVRILERTVSAGGAIEYDFINPLMRQYVLLRQAERRGLIGSQAHKADPDASPPRRRGNRKVQALAGNRL